MPSHAKWLPAFFYTDFRPLPGPAALLDRKLNGLLTRRLLHGGARGLPGEHLLVAGNHTLAADWVLFAGGGTRSELTPFTLSGLVGSLLDVLHQAGFRKVALVLDELAGMSVADAEKAVWDLLDRDRLSMLEVALACRVPQG